MGQWFQARLPLVTASLVSPRLQLGEVCLSIFPWSTMGRSGWGTYLAIHAIRQLLIGENDEERGGGNFRGNSPL